MRKEIKEYEQVKKSRMSEQNENEMNQGYKRLGKDHEDRQRQLQRQRQ